MSARPNEDMPTQQMSGLKGTGAPASGIPQGAGGVGETAWLSDKAPRYHGGDADKTVLLSAPATALAWLVITSGPRRGTLCTIRGDQMTIGRDPDNDLIIDDPAVSGRHAKIKVEKEEGEEGFFLYDLASTNGTFIRGEKILRHRLQDGDRILFGQTEAIFKKL